MRTRDFAFNRQLTLLIFLLFSVVLPNPSAGRAESIMADINVTLRPVAEKIPLVTDITLSVIRSSFVRRPDWSSGRASLLAARLIFPSFSI